VAQVREVAPAPRANVLQLFSGTNEPLQNTVYSEDSIDTQIPCTSQAESNRPGRQPKLTLLSHSACQYQDHSIDTAYSYLRLARFM